MTDDRSVSGLGNHDDRAAGGGPGLSASDEKALTDLFASLVADGPASEISPLAVIKLGRIDQRTALDAKIKRFKVLRNVLVAAAFAALVVLIVPHLGARSAESAASSSSASVAAAPAAAASKDYRALVTGSPAGSAAAGGAAAGGAAAPQARASSAGSESPASAAAAMSAAAAPAPTNGGVRPDTAAAPSGVLAPSAAGARCPPLSAGSLAAVRATFPAGYFGAATAATDCAGSGSNRPVAGSVLTINTSPGAALVVTVVRAATGACVPAGCVRRPSPDADTYLAPAGSSVWVYGNGYQVLLETNGKLVRPLGIDQLVTAGRAVITALR